MNNTLAAVIIIAIFAVLVIGVILRSQSVVARRDARRRNTEPVIYIPPYDPDDDSTKTDERGYNDAGVRKPRGRIQS